MVAVIDIVSVLAMVAVCYGAGLLATSARGQRAYQRMDDRLLDLVPRYGFIKSMASGLHKETTTAMTVVLVPFDDQSQIGFEVERNEDWVVVFLPGSPDPWSGAVSYVTADRVTPLPVDFNRAVRAMRMAGRDSLSLLEAGPRGGGARPPSPT